jgi:methylenetetrahydrofolate dehydrogenase (NADP+)/methenyltetrahydrofolate cyclohydrolase
MMDGKALAVRVRSEVAAEVARLRALGLSVGLGTLIVGDDPGSHSYVAGKHRDCAEVGISSIRRELPASSSASDVWGAISDLNADAEVTGFIVQLPLPESIDPDAALAAVLPQKDADGLSPFNLGQLMLGAPGPRPCTPSAIVELLLEYQIALAGARVVIVGRGTTVGRPLSVLLSQKGFDATVTLCHSRTKDLAELTSQADVLVAALGHAAFVKPNMVKPGACVIDVGLTRTDRGLIGDVAPEVEGVAGYLTPVPGGVGPMTRAMLLRNVVSLASSKLEVGN